MTSAAHPRGTAPAQESIGKIGVAVGCAYIVECRVKLGVVLLQAVEQHHVVAVGAAPAAVSVKMHSKTLCCRHHRHHHRHRHHHHHHHHHTTPPATSIVTSLTVTAIRLVVVRVAAGPLKMHVVAHFGGQGGGHKVVLDCRVSVLAALQCARARARHEERTSERCCPSCHGR